MRFIFCTCILIIIYFISCNNDDKIADELYKNRSYLIKEFSNIEVIKREDNFYIMSFIMNDKINSFYFKKEGDSIELVRDSIQFPLYQIVSLNKMNESDLINYRNIVLEKLNGLLGEMDSLNILGIRTFSSEGIDIKFYLRDFYALIYVKRYENVKSERYKNYILSGKKLDANWFLVKDELEKR